MTDELVDKVFNNAQELLCTDKKDIEKIKKKLSELNKNFNELKKRERYLNSPDDINLPFFAYGIFKPGQLAYSIIENHIETKIYKEIPYKLFERDGIPFLDIKEMSEKEKKNPDIPMAKGYLIDFKEEHRQQAYDDISGIEPRKYYRWLNNKNRSFNVLVGKNPTKSNPRLVEDGNYNAKQDVYFTRALALITDEMKKYKVSTEFEDFFKLQRNYILLWAAIERYNSLKYGEGNKTENNNKLAKEPFYKRAFEKYVTEKREIFRTDKLKTPIKLDPSEPEKSMNYYYAVRSNVVHRGKSVIETDEITLRKSLLELLNIFQDVLEETIPGINVGSRVDVNLVESNVDHVEYLICPKCGQKIIK